MYEYKGIKIHWLGHDAFWIEAKGKNIYLDPYELGKKDLPSADVIISSHEHFDHCNPDAINQISSNNTLLVGPKIVQGIFDEKINSKKGMRELNPGDSIEVEGIKISAIPAYNIHRFRDPETKTPFHPKESGHIGPILDIEGITIYHAGDADKIPEMENLNPTIALVPISGKYVMDVEEAIEATKAINAEITIPMHIGRGIGSLDFVKEFKNKLPDYNIITMEIEED